MTMAYAVSCSLKMWRENDFRGTQRGNRRTLLISMVNDLLDPKITVPTSKGVDSYVQSTAKHSNMGQKWRIIILRHISDTLIQPILFYFNGHGTSEYGSHRSMFSVYEIEMFWLH